MPRKKRLPDTAVLEAAGRVFGRVGLARFTLAEVAAEAGVAPATLVQRFGSKRALMPAFAEHAASLARRPFEQARVRVGEPLGALRAALLMASRATKGRHELSQSLAFVLEDVADEELRARAARARPLDSSEHPRVARWRSGTRATDRR